MFRRGHRAQVRTAQEIADAARQYAADPEASDYSREPLPAQLYNSEIANQAKLDVVINSDAATTRTTPTYGRRRRERRWTPVLQSRGRPERSLLGGGQWTDVSVKERNLPSLFGSIGLPLSEISPERVSRSVRAQRTPVPSAGNSEQRDREGAGALLRRVHEPADADRACEISSRSRPPTRPRLLRRAVERCGVCRGPDPNVGDGSAFFALTLPSYSPSCGDYLPVGVEVRLASTDIDLNQSCAALITARFADCFHRRSQIRVWNDGNADSQIRIPRVALTGGCGSPADGYFGPVPVAAVNCRYDVTVDVNWGTRSKDA